MNKKAMGAMLGMILLMIFAVCSVSAGAATTPLMPIKASYVVIFGIVLGVIIATVMAWSPTVDDVGYEEKKDHAIPLIEKSKEEILFYTDLDKNFFAAPEAVKAIKGVIRRGVNIRIIYDQQAKEKFGEIPEIAELINKGIIKAKSEKNEMDRHFWVGDSRHIRVDRHEFLEFGKSTEGGKIKYNTAVLGAKWRDRFNGIWGELDGS